MPHDSLLQPLSVLYKILYGITAEKGSAHTVYRQMDITFFFKDRHETPKDTPKEEKCDD